MSPRLAADHRLLCADLRRFGWSDAPRSSDAKQEFANDVIALLDALELNCVRPVVRAARKWRRPPCGPHGARMAYR